ncbi:MAG: thioredoxin domain-containing protein [Acidobacteriota bacterium]
MSFAKSPIRTVLLPILLVLLFAPAALVADEPTPSNPKVIAANFYADWCVSCKKLTPVFEALTQKYANQPVLFVQFDQTDGTTRAQAADLASTLGVSDAYTAYRGAGFVLLLDGESHQEIGKFTVFQDINAMDAALRKLLESR